MESDLPDGLHLLPHALKPLFNLLPLCQLLGPGWHVVFFPVAADATKPCRRHQATHASSTADREPPRRSACSPLNSECSGDSPLTKPHDANLVEGAARDVAQRTLIDLIALLLEKFQGKVEYHQRLVQPMSNTPKTRQTVQAVLQVLDQGTRATESWTRKKKNKEQLKNMELRSG